MEMLIFQEQCLNHTAHSPEKRHILPPRAPRMSILLWNSTLWPPSEAELFCHSPHQPNAFHIGPPSSGRSLLDQNLMGVSLLVDPRSHVSVLAEKNTGTEFGSLFWGYRIHMAVNSPNITVCCSKGARQPAKK